MAFPENYLEGEKAKIFLKSKFFLSGTMNYPKKTGFNLYQSGHCAYITYSMYTLKVPWYRFKYHILL